MTINTLWLANLETLTQQLLESAGRIWDGPGILREIKILPKDHTIDITLIASCARNLVTVQTTVVNQPLSPANPSSPSTSSKISSQSISEPFLRTSIGNDGLMINFEDLDFWLRSQGASDGSLEEEMTRQFCEKLLLMIHKAVWQT